MPLHTERAGIASVAANMTGCQQADVNSQPVDHSPTQLMKMGTQQCAVAVTEAELQTPTDLEAGDRPAALELPHQALLEPAELRHQSPAQAEHQIETEAEQQAIGSEQQVDAQSEQQSLSCEILGQQQQSLGSAQQELDAVCLQMAASNIAEEAELSSLQQLLKLCGQDVRGHLQHDDVIAHLHLLHAYAEERCVQC